MYAWIWRKLPGNLWAKLSTSVVTLTAIVALLWYVVFPWATPLLPFDDVQVTSGDGTSQEEGGLVNPSSDPSENDSAVDPDASAPDAIPYNTASNDSNPGLAGD
ncbi:hypothetical protein [Actinoplanes sp. NPDC051851]|uniref:hypothetical protein n=1 Tax=Actinoplanes sp. NPDC051851 TaxID=3154753 RepID=UPI0034400901